MAHLGLGNLALIRGKLAEAERQTRLGIGVNEHRGLAGNALAGPAKLALQSVRFRGDSAGAVRILEDGLRQHPLRSVPTLDRPGAELALVYAVAGQGARARQLLSATKPRCRKGSAAASGSGSGSGLGGAGGRAGPATPLPRSCREENRRNARTAEAREEGVAFERANLPDSALAAYQRAAGRGTVIKPISDAWGLAPSPQASWAELYEERGTRPHGAAGVLRPVRGTLEGCAIPVLQRDGAGGARPDGRSWRGKGSSSSGGRAGGRAVGGRAVRRSGGQAVGRSERFVIPNEGTELAGRVPKRMKRSLASLGMANP